MVVPKAVKLLVSIKKKKNGKPKATTRGEGGTDAASPVASTSKQSQRGIFGALQRTLWRRYKPSRSVVAATAGPVDGFARAGSPSPAATINAAASFAFPSVSRPSFSVLKSVGQDVQAASAAAAASAPHRPVDEEEEFEDDGEDQEDADVGDDDTSAKRRKHSRWVPKLLVPAEKMRDRNHTKKKRAKKHGKPAVPRPPALFTVVNALSMELLAHIMAFLASNEPGQRCSRVNRMLAAGVRTYYALYYAHPRPRGFLVHRVLLSLTDESFLRRILVWLPVQDRVRASGTCLAFLRCCDAMPLEIASDRRARAFMSSIGKDETRLQARFTATGTLQLVDMTAETASRVFSLMGTGDVECFPLVNDLAIARVNGFGRGRYFEVVMQVLFTDRVSSQLQSLRLEDVDLEDAQFQQLARLLHGREFPALRRLTLTQLAFPSRFMRDWVRCFVLGRFRVLEHLDTIDVSMGDEDMRRFFTSLRLAPMLSSLAISHNAVSLETMMTLVGLLATREYLPRLAHLECEAVTADPNATRALVEALMRANDLRPLCCINIGANPLGTVQGVPNGMPRSHWRLLTRLNLSSMQLGEDAFRSVIEAFSPSKVGESSAVEHLDVSNNGFGAAADAFARQLRSGRFRHLRSLSLAGNAMQALELEAVTAALSSSCCPLLEELDLSGNAAAGEGASRFCRFLRSHAARRLVSLDLSDNAIPHRGQVQIAEALRGGACLTLRHLNLSRNPKLATLVPFQEAIRSGACPSLVSLQISYAQTFADGQALVRAVRSRISVDELRRLKQERFEARLRTLQAVNEQRAAEALARGKRQARALRERYDVLESEADRALRRRKLIRKSAHLLIHQEIDRRLREHEHRARVRALTDRR